MSASLDNQFKIQKPNYFSAPKAIGAHITVAYPEENIVLLSSEIGKKHIFSVKNLYHVTLGAKKYLVLIVSAPSL